MLIMKKLFEHAFLRKLFLISCKHSVALITARRKNSNKTVVSDFISGLDLAVAYV